ncbi:L-rhamnose mutarotase [Roseobacter fucihabitans]|uniref:L-rhamnose mutarotase n=2 Tax=Roseobacter fucihabitans TaxID=1537242 RepID=A0ABZ2BPZ1_9RHOB|nr:L-rhamnose mutarotase [Roseobacter litoralis]
MVRMGGIIGVNPDKITEYKRLHADVWPQVLEKITQCHIRNYVIYLREPENLLFAHFEYHGTDWAADSAKIASDPVTLEWWAVCGPCQRQLDSLQKGEWWAPMEEVFFHP